MVDSGQLWVEVAESGGLEREFCAAEMGITARWERPAGSHDATGRDKRQAPR
jgi:hypothetical protein